MKTASKAGLWSRKARWIPCTVIVSVLLCYSSTAYQGWAKSSLESLYGSNFSYALFSAGFYGTFMVIPFVMIPMGVLLLIGHLLKLRPYFTAALMFSPALVLSGWLIRGGMQWQDPRQEPQRFASFTQLAWPEQSRCVMAKHGGGFSGWKLLWAFEGPPEDFERHKSQLPWKGREISEGSVEDYCSSLRFPMEKVQFAFDLSGSWRPAEIYHWDKKNGSSFTYAYILVNEAHTRWAFWWTID